MVELRQIYKCQDCGVIIEVLHGGNTTLKCCDKPMVLIDENSVDAATEKHVPVVEKVEDGVLVKVGSMEHPMQDTHFIEFIEIHTQNKVCRKHLNPGEKPQAYFKTGDEKVEYAREYCNLHGLWRSK